MNQFMLLFLIKVYWTLRADALKPYLKMLITI